MDKLILEMKETSRILTGIVHEYNKAKLKHPKWVTDILHADAIINKEKGELTKEILNLIYEDSNIEQVKKEAYQLGAMVLRFIENLENYDLNNFKTLRNKQNLITRFLKIFKIEL